jgi:hypothetical protein
MRLLIERGEWVVEVDRRAVGRPAAAARATPWTLSAPPGRCWVNNARHRRVGAETGRPCGCCWPPATGPGGADLCYQPAQALIVDAPEELRAELRGRSTNGQVTACAALRDRPARSLEHRMTVRALRATAQRIRVLAAEAAEFGGRDRPAGGRGRAVAAGAAGDGADQSRPSAGELVACSPGALGGGLCRPGRRQPHPGVLRAGHPPSAELRWGPAAESGAAHCGPVRLRDDPVTAPMRPVGGPRARAHERSADASSAPSQGTCSSFSSS